MKKFYSMMVMAIISLVAFQASAYSITLVFDNSAAIGSVIVYSDYEKAQIQRQFTPAESMVVDFDDNSKILDVVAAEGYVLSECVFTTTVTNTYFQNAYKNNHEIYLSGGYDGATYTYKTINMAELRTNSATVTVNGDISKVALQFSGTWSYATLHEGENVVKFMDSESTFTIGPKSYGQTLYSVLQNGVEVQKPYEYSSSWSLNVANGDQIVINADFPNLPCNISFSFAEDGTEDYVTAVYLNQQNVENWKEGFVANGGDNLYFTVDVQKYKVIDFRLNGEAKNINGSYNTTVDGDAMEFYFDVEEYGICKAGVTVDTPANVLYRVGYSGDFLPAPSTQFEVEVPEYEASYTPVYFKAANENVYISSVVAGENAISKNYDGTYSTNITDGMQISVTSETLVRETTAYFYFHNPGDAQNYNISLYGYYFQSSFTNNWSLSQGYNLMTFGDVDNPFTFQVSGDANYIDGYAYIYVNDQLVHRDQTAYNLVWTLNLAQDDVVKAYIQTDKTAPSTYTVTFDFDGIDVMPEIVCDYVKHVSLDDVSRSGVSLSVLPGTHISIKVPEGCTAFDEVMVGEEALVAGEDGTYSFDVLSDVTAKVTTGVSSVTADELRGLDTRIFNLQGVEVKSDRLPAGIYISAGRKFVVR